MLDIRKAYDTVWNMSFLRFEYLGIDFASNGAWDMHIEKQ